MAALATGLLVAVVAGGFGLAGATLAARREHDRWLRQTQFEAASEYLAAALAVIPLVEAGSGSYRKPPSDAAAQAHHRLLQTAARTALVGPSSADRSAEALFDNAFELLEDPQPSTADALNIAREHYVDAIRAHFKIALIPVSE